MASRRQVIGAGDSDTDATMVRDATGAHIAINRNKPELMCHAYANTDGRWVVNPMFIEPLPQLQDAVPLLHHGPHHRRREGGPGDR